MTLPEDMEDRYWDDIYCEDCGKDLEAATQFICPKCWSELCEMCYMIHDRQGCED